MGSRYSARAALAMGVVALVSACEMSQTYRKPATNKSFLIEGSLKPNDLEGKLGGCDRGAIVVEAMKDKTKQVFEIGSSGFINEEKMSVGALRVNGASDPTKVEGYKPMDMGGSIGMSLNMAGAGTGAGSTASAASVPAVLSMSKGAHGKYFVRDQSAMASNQMSFSQVSQLSQAATASDVTGVGHLKSFSLDQTLLEDQDFDFPPDVEAGKHALSSISGKIGEEGLTIKIPAGKPSADALDVTSVEFHYPKSGYAEAEQDPTGVFFVETPTTADANGYLDIKIPSKGLKPGEVIADVTRHHYKATDVKDAKGGKVCVDARSAVRVKGNIAK